MNDSKLLNEKVSQFLEKNKKLTAMPYDKGCLIVNQNRRVICDVEKSNFRDPEDYAQTCAILCSITHLAEIFLIVDENIH